MTNPSETATKLRNLAKWLDRENDESTGNIAREAADTIDRLTSTGAGKWPARRINIPHTDKSAARIVGFIIEPGDEAYGTHGLSEPLAWLDRMCAASPREGHVEVPLEPTEAMLAAGFEYCVAEWPDDECRKALPDIYRAMLAAHQGETKP